MSNIRTQNVRILTFDRDSIIKYIYCVYFFKKRRKEDFTSDILLKIIDKQATMSNQYIKEETDVYTANVYKHKQNTAVNDSYCHSKGFNYSKLL